MESKEFLERLLNFGGDWSINDIIINNDLKEINIFLKYNKPNGLCPVTNSLCKIYDFNESRIFRHLDLFDFNVYINARIPRVINNSNEVNTIKTGWSGDTPIYLNLR